MRLALCDEQWLFASVLAAAFDRQGHEVLITTEQPEELLAAAIRFHPDLCVFDVVDDRPATIQRLRELRPSPYIVLLADTQDERAWDVYDDGIADGVVSKACGLQAVGYSTG